MAEQEGTSTKEAPKKEEVAVVPPATSPTPTIDTKVIKHPLNTKWVMWFDAPAKRSGANSAEEWTMNLKRLVEFDTVEDFWCLWNNLTPASKLAFGSNYHMFREGIEPKWEDPINARGGKWVANVNKQPKNNRPLDELWLFTCLACIGEQFGDEWEMICGVVVSPRIKFDRVCLWTKDITRQDELRKIGRSFKTALELPETMKVQFQYHQDSVKSKQSWNQTYMEV